MKNIFLSVKLIFSPIKTLLCIAIVSLMPLLIKASSMYELYIVYASYISIIAVIIFSEIPLLDINSGMEDIVYLTKEKAWKTYAQRIISAMITLSLLILLSGYIFVMRISYQNILIAYDLKSQVLLLVNVMPYILLVGVCSMTISNIFRSVHFAYVIGTIYWLLNILFRKDFIQASLNDNKTLIYVLVVSFILLLINLILDSIKPDKRGYLVKILKIDILKEKILELCKEYNIIMEENY